MISLPSITYLASSAVETFHCNSAHLTFIIIITWYF